MRGTLAAAGQLGIRLGRRASRRVPPAVIRAAKRTPLGRLATIPQLSVIVPVYNVQGYLDECLQSVLRQSLRSIEIIVVDDGSTDSSPEILRRFAARDRRITVIRQSNAGLGAARNTGITAARAKYMTFLDSDDTIPSTAYEHMVTTLNRTQSDFAVGAVRRVTNGKNSRPTWVTNVHSAERLKITIDDFPDAMQDVIACNRMFRREFWDTKIGPFPEGMAYEDHAPMVTAYVRARSFDLLAETTYNWRIREDATSIGQQKHETQNLRDRIHSKKLAWAVVSEESSDKVAAAWLGRVLDLDLSAFIVFALAADDEYRSVLREGLARFVELADAEAWAHVRVDVELRCSLAAAGRWDETNHVIEYFRLNGALPPTKVRDGRVFADLPFTDALGLPADRFELSGHQTSLSSCLLRACWEESGALQIEGWAFARAIELHDEEETISLHLVEAATGQTVPVPVEQFSSPLVTRWANHPSHRYDRAGFRARIDVDALVAELGDRPGQWQLRIRTETQGVVREGLIYSVVRAGLAKRMTARAITDSTDPVRIIPIVDNALGFVIQVRHDYVRAVELRTDAGQLSGRLRCLQPRRDLRSIMVRSGTTTSHTADLRRLSDGTYAFSLQLPVGTSQRHWDVRAVDTSHREHRVSWPSEAENGTEIGAFGAGTALWQRTPRAFVELSTDVSRCRVTAIQVNDESIVVDVIRQGHPWSALQQTQLRSSAAIVPISSVETLPSDALLEGDRCRLIFPTDTSSWDGPTLPLPAATYTLGVPLEDGRMVLAHVSPELLRTMPLDYTTRRHRVTVGRVPGNEILTVYLGPPLGDEERGRYAQRQLTSWYDSTDFEPRDAVLFQCYRGEFATDSQLAIHQELRRRQAPLDLLWGVSDLSVVLPEGATPVVMGSREWYEAIGSARYLCNNIDFDRFFRRRDYQKFLQTFHGYPFKSMGIAFWESRGTPERIIDFECDRRNAAWTSIVVPADFCEEMYRREYRYRNEVLVTGYPRDDALVNANAAAVRADVLTRLGIPEEKTVVLYAPTWRDTGSTGAWSAKFFDELDLDQLTAELGDDYVLLLRGHNYNLRDGAIGSSHATVVDVTRYPEINDLTLAADVALLDYSSLRFDWAITGKPMLFFVPDLDDYLGSRSALFEYAPTAPGPILHTTGEVVNALRDLDSVAERYSQQIATFNTEYNQLHDGLATRRVVDAFFGDDGGRIQ